MEKDRLKQLYFSAHAFHTFQSCPLKFQRRYIDGLFWKRRELDHQKILEKQEQGRKFHLMAERYFLQIPTGAELLAEEEDLKRWIERLQQFLPIQEESRYFPEYEIHWNEGNIKLQGKYDLILRDAWGNYTIYDWKTQEKAISPTKIEKSFQSILYRYLLVEGSKILFGEAVKPEQIRMIYWQPNHPSMPIVLSYDDACYGKDRRTLEKWVEDILSYPFDTYTKEKTDRQNCRYCEYQEICHGSHIDDLEEEQTEESWIAINDEKENF